MNPGSTVMGLSAFCCCVHEYYIPNAIGTREEVRIPREPAIHTRFLLADMPTRNGNANDKATMGDFPFFLFSHRTSRSRIHSFPIGEPRDDIAYNERARE